MSVVRRHWTCNLRSIIKLKVSENPKKPGSKTRQRFALYRSGMTVEDYCDACRNAKVPRSQDALLDITWDSAPEHGFIEIVEP